MERTGYVEERLLLESNKDVFSDLECARYMKQGHSDDLQWMDSGAAG